MDENGTVAMVKAITDRYEAKDSSAAFDKLSDEYIDRMVKSIAGFRIEVESMDNVFKLSQNHDEVVRQSIMKHLEERGDGNSRMIADEMKKSKSAKTKTPENL